MDRSNESWVIEFFVINSVLSDLAILCRFRVIKLS